MDCPNCGEKLKNTNQKFCPNCGKEISPFFESPQLKTEREQYASTSSSQLTLKSSSPQIIQQKKISSPFEGPGVHSKKCLVYSIISLTLVSVFGTYYFVFLFYPIELIKALVVYIVSCVGLGFGIFAEINSSEARKLEPQNRLEGVGSVLSIIGMAMNTIIITFILLLLTC